MKKFLIILLSFFLLSACSIKEKPENKENFKIGEVLYGRESISYLVEDEAYDDEGTYVHEYGKDSKKEPYNNFGKNSHVSQIIHTKDGKMTVYNTEYDLTIKDIAKKNDKDVLKLAKKQDKNYFEGEKESLISSLTSEKEEFFSEEEVQQDKKFAKKVESKKYKLYSPKKMKKLEVETDESGNKTKIEKFPFYNAYIEDDWYQEGLRTHYKKFNELLHPQKIYKSKFAGLKSLDFDDDIETPPLRYTYLVTKVGDKVKKSHFDKADDKYVNVKDE